MKRVGLILSIIGNIVLLVVLGFVLANPKKCVCEKCVMKEPTTSAVCEKEIARDADTDVLKTFSRVEMEYTADGTVNNLLSGTVKEYTSDVKYNEVLKELPESSKDLGNRKIFYYEAFDTSFADDKEVEHEIWYKDYIASLKADGYQCQ